MDAFWLFLDYGLNAKSKTGNFGLNAAFNIEILINRIKILIFFTSKKKKKKLAAFKPKFLDAALNPYSKNSITEIPLFGHYKT